jgi:uncharacterized RDD family membrane protein YckC/ribosomal protein L40E
VDASAAQKQPVTKTCLQCGAILPSGVSACRFCESIFQNKLSAPEGASVLSRWSADPAGGDERCPENGVIHMASEGAPPIASEREQESTWRGELANRVEAYRVRRRKVAPDAAQSRLPFAEPIAMTYHDVSVAIAEPPSTGEEDFAFTIAIGRVAAERPVDGRMVIDVSMPEDAESARSETEERRTTGLYPVAPLASRRIAGIIDAVCLLFACGAFLALFSSVGGQFTLSKMSAAVYMAIFAVVYLQYFALFTVFGGTTPGMMCRGLQVVSFSGAAPTPRQMLLRSGGYLLSAGTCFMGFLWAMWDEDELTWHDRFSRTYLSAAQTYAEIESHTAANPH